MEPAHFLETTEKDARTLLATAEIGWKRPVPQCPEWSASDLVAHLGGVFLWMSAVVRSGKRVSRRTLDTPPTDPTELALWYLTALEQALTTLGSADPDSETWTYSSLGDRRVGWWCRRLAVEVAIHRWDAQQAASAEGASLSRPVDGIIAAAGIGEFLLEFVPGLIARKGLGDQSRTLRFRATDGNDEWQIDLGAGEPATPGHPTADAAVRGSRSDLLLWLVRSDLLVWLVDRGRADRGRSESFELSGDPLSSTIGVQSQD